ncbi:MAG: nucleotidyltransferase family protein [Propionibacteriaceae bacterium]|nr:nucleotidyltransferase family protein [Propionibacteriaceae bacterium]
MLDLNIDERRLAELCNRYGIMRLAVFGSVARGEATADSDIDLLYDLRPGAHLGWEIEDLTDELADVFGGRPVDLISRSALHPLIRHQVLSEAEPIHVPA